MKNTKNILSTGIALIAALLVSTEISAMDQQSLAKENLTFYRQLLSTKTSVNDPLIGYIGNLQHQITNNNIEINNLKVEIDNLKNRRR